MQEECGCGMVGHNGGLDAVSSFKRNLLLCSGAVNYRLVAKWSKFKALLSGLVHSKWLKYFSKHWKDRPLPCYFILFSFIYFFEAQRYFFRPGVFFFVIAACDAKNGAQS